MGDYFGPMAIGIRAARAALPACAVLLSACLFGGDQDRVLAPPDPSGDPPSPGIYRGDYGPAASGIESELVLKADGGFEFTGIRDNEAVFRLQGKHTATTGILSVFGLSMSASTNGFFTSWSAASGFATGVVALTDGSFRRLEPSPVESFNVSTDSVDKVGKFVPQIWVTYRPVPAGEMDSGGYSFRQAYASGPLEPYQVVGAIDLSGCDGGRFSFSTSILGSRIWGSSSSSGSGGWLREEWAAEKWSFRGTFVVAENARFRTVSDSGVGLWSVSGREMLFRVKQLDPDRFLLWRSADAIGPGFWTPIFAWETRSPCQPTPPVVNTAPKFGWYRGDYGELTQYGLESDLILSADSIQFIGAVDNYAIHRLKGKYTATESRLTLSEFSFSGASGDPRFEAWHAGIFDSWNGALRDSTDSIVVFADGSFKRFESVQDVFGPAKDSILRVVKNSPRIWVTYRPATDAPLSPGRYVFRDSMLENPLDPLRVYRDLDMSRCDGGKFHSHFFLFGSRAWGNLPPGNAKGWSGVALEGEQWSQKGSFIVVQKFQERDTSESGAGAWAVSQGEYLLRVKRDGDDGLQLWWTGDGVNPGFWNRLQRDPQPVCAMGANP